MENQQTNKLKRWLAMHALTGGSTLDKPVAAITGGTVANAVPTAIGGALGGLPGAAVGSKLGGHLGITNLGREWATVGTDADHRRRRLQETDDRLTEGGVGGAAVHGAKRMAPLGATLGGVGGLMALLYATQEGKIPAATSNADLAKTVAAFLGAGTLAGTGVGALTGSATGGLYGALHGLSGKKEREEAKEILANRPISTALPFGKLTAAIRNR